MPIRNRAERHDDDASIARIDGADRRNPLFGLITVDTENAMSDRKFEYGDRVRHATRPEWGIGLVVKTELLSTNGQQAQRLAVRFPNDGLKTISTAHAELELVIEDAVASVADGEVNPLGGWDKMKDSEWLGAVAQRKVREVMVGLSERVRDPFRPVEERLRACLDLFRFDRTGRSLVEWAVAQSGLDDPLSRFTRHELEVLFDEWATNRQQHLQQLFSQAPSDPQLVNRLLAGAPPAAQASVRRLNAGR